MATETPAEKIIRLLEPKVILFYPVLMDDAHEEANFLVEGGLTMELNKKWSARFDSGLQPNQQNHLHVMKNGRDVTIINVDGTPSHNTNISDLPRKVRERVKKLNLVYMEESRFLTETASFGGNMELARLIGLFWTKAQRGY